MRSAIGWGMFFWASLALGPQGSRAADGHSHARPEHVRVRHVDLDLAVGHFQGGKEDEILGAAVTVMLPAKVKAVRIHYATGPEASGLQWLGREQTSGKKHPFLFTQSEAIHARSWIPLQDSPGVRVTYSARIRTPKGIRAVMRAPDDPINPRTGEHRFEMKQAVPPYLIALA